MGNVFILDEDIEFPDVYGVITDLPPWKMCYLIARQSGLELSHEDILNRPTDPIKHISHNELTTFEKYIWFDEDTEQFLHLIENKKSVERSTTGENTKNKDLFGDVSVGKQYIYLLEEWSHVNYLIRTEGLESVFNPFNLKGLQGVRMVVKTSTSDFKNYDKIL